MASREIQIFGKKIRVNLFSQADESVFEEVFVDKDYKCLDEIIRGAKNCVVDIGAHKGFFGIYASLLNPNVRIFAIEPQSENFTAMKENIHDNRIKNVICKNVAIGKSDCERELNLSDDSHNHSFVKGEGSVGIEKVQTVSLNTVFERYLMKAGIDHCDLLKMDCEGAEFEVFSGDLDAKILRKINNIYIEYHKFEEGVTETIIEQILSKNGFKILKKPSHYDSRMGFILARRV